MADFAEILQTYSSLAVDYTALYELGDPGLLNSLVDYIINQQKTVFVSKSFKVLHECVQRANNPKDRPIYGSIKNAIRSLVDVKLLRASKSASNVDFFLEHIGNEDECLFIGRNGNSFSRLRNINASGKCAVFVVNHGRIKFYTSLSECFEAEKAYTVNPISGNSDFIASDNYFSVGDILVTDDGEEITLTSLISTGAEGLVFCTQHEEWVAKVYHRGGITPLRWYKLMKMRALELETDNICWPCRLLFSRNRIPVGYMMRKASGTTISRAFDGPDAMEKYFPGWTRLSVVNATLSFLYSMEYLHLHGVIAGDIQLKNAMIEDEDNLFLIDMDSVQYQDLPCPVGTEEFTRPELWDKSFVTFLRRPQDEDYSISILVFSMLFCGQHPYAQRNGLEMLRDEMEAHSFPYTVDDSENERIPYGGYDKIWDALTPELKEMFVRAFKDGDLFDSLEWACALREYRDKLVAFEYPNAEVYRVFPYFVKEVQAPVKKAGKLSIREAVMNMNSAEMSSQYTSQMPSAHVAEQKKPEVKYPSFKGTVQPPVKRATHASSENGSQSSALMARMNAMNARKEENTHTEAVPEPKEKPASPEPKGNEPEQHNGFGRFFRKKRD